LFSAFIVLQLTYNILGNLYIGEHFTNDLSLFTRISVVVALFYFFRNLWVNTTETAIQYFKDRRIDFYWNLLSFVLIFATAKDFYEKFHHLNIFHDNTLAFLAFGAMDMLSILALFQLFFKSLALSMYRIKNSD
jgi:hypothetical protein